MSESKRKQREAARLAATLIPAVARIAAALRKHAMAASSQLGSDCYIHAELGRLLLKDLGFEARLVVGFAAWRVGARPDDVIGHVPHLKAYLPTGGMGFAYHAWLECGAFLIDFTTYQLQRKAQQLDAADGGRTTVTWCPGFLCLQRRQLRGYRDLLDASVVGLAYYEAHPEFDRVLRSQFQLDPTDLFAVRLSLANPDMKVIGPNDFSA